MRQCVDLFLADEPAPHRLVDGLTDQISVHMAGLEQVQNRTQWACNSHAVHLLQVTFGKICSVKNQNFRDSAVAAKMFGVCHMQLRGHDIGEFVKTESRVVTVGSFRNWNDPLNWHTRDGHTLRERKHEWREESDIPGSSSERP